MVASEEQLLVKRLDNLRDRVAAGSRGTLATNYGTYNGERREALKLAKKLISVQSI